MLSKVGAGGIIKGPKKYLTKYSDDDSSTLPHRTVSGAPITSLPIDSNRKTGNKFLTPGFHSETDTIKAILINRMI